MTRPRSLLCVVAPTVLAAASAAMAGPDWVEGSIDAGSTIGTAQHTLGTGQLNSISGGLSGGGDTLDLEDMFIISITTPTLFTLTTGAANFDPQLFLFNITVPGEAFGLLANDNTPT